MVVVFACFWRQPETLPLGRLIFWAALFRVCRLFGVPLFEDDWFRYLWDGYRFAQTGTPYGWAPVESFTNPNVPLVFQRILDGRNTADFDAILGATTARAQEAGARVVHEQAPGYGNACLAAIGALKSPDVIVFIDADHAFEAAQATRLLDCIAAGADLAIGSRTLGRTGSRSSGRHPGAYRQIQRSAGPCAAQLLPAPVSLA